MYFQKLASFVLCFLMFTAVSFAKDKPMENAWFQNQHCSQLVIKKPKSISEHKIIKSVTIDDLAVIDSFIRRISSIPANGDEMRSFGPNAEEIALEFHCDNQIQTISIYQRKFKTPSTGFNSERNKTEDSLYQDIDALLFPDFDKHILLIKNLALSFKDFAITYTGVVTNNDAPVTASITEHHFLITERNKSVQHVQVVAGQLPPQPLAIEVNGKKAMLLSYETRDGIRLYPHYFQITR